MLALAASGIEEGLWLCAKRQVNGRGRLGRHWESPKGNFYGSTIIRLQPNDPAPPTLAFVASVALIEILISEVPSASFILKWPNDVLVGDAKISGILLERANDAVILGIGVNLLHHPEGLDRPVTSLAALGAPVPDPAEFAEKLAGHFAQWLARWRRGEVGSVIQAWESHAVSVGSPLLAHLPDGEKVEGRYEGLGSDGALRLCLADGSVRVIHAGDVFLV